MEEDGQLHTLGLLEQLRDQCKSLWGTSSELYFRVDKLVQQLANPNLRDIPSNLQIHVEQWDRYDKHAGRGACFLKARGQISYHKGACGDERERRAKSPPVAKRSRY
jgi:hypothetical protein